MTWLLKLDLDRVMIYHHTKNQVSMSRNSKVIASTHTQHENITFPHTRAVKILMDQDFWSDGASINLVSKNMLCCLDYHAIREILLFLHNLLTFLQNGFGVKEIDSL